MTEVKKTITVKLTHAEAWALIRAAGFLGSAFLLVKDPDGKTHDGKARKGRTRMVLRENGPVETPVDTDVLPAEWAANRIFGLLNDAPADTEAAAGNAEFARELVIRLRSCEAATVNHVKAVNFARGSKTAQRAEEAAYRSVFKFVVGRDPTGDELDAILG